MYLGLTLEDKRAHSYRLDAHVGLDAQAVSVTFQERIDLCRDELDGLFRGVRELCRLRLDPKDEPVLNLRWEYGEPPEHAAVLREIAGEAEVDLVDGKRGRVRAGGPLPEVRWVRGDGTTSCGNWLYAGCGCSPDGESADRTRAREMDDPTGASDLRAGIAHPLRVFPNPFNPSTIISYIVSSAGPVTLRVYSVNGELVDMLLDQEFKPAGEYHIRYTTTGPSGVYFVRIHTPSQVQNAKIVYLK